MTAPMQKSVEAAIAAGPNDTTDPETIIGPVPFDGTVSAVTFYPVADQSGANTNSRTFQIYNRGQAGAGTTLVASLAFLSGVDMTGEDAKSLTLSGTAANLVVAEGDVLEFVNLHVGSGMTSVAGKVVVTVTRDGAS